MKILILGGTKEAAELAAQLVETGHDVTSSLAGRTKEPKPISGNLRVGGFGGARGLANFIKDHNFEKLIDATHPFAKQISENAIEAAKNTKIRFEIIARPAWKKRDGDNWIDVGSLEEARDALPPHARVLLALGSQYIDLFKTRDDVYFLVRMVDFPKTPPSLPNHELLLGKPSAAWKDEAIILENHKITHILCRNSGGVGAYAKIEAARELQIPVIMIRR